MSWTPYFHVSPKDPWPAYINMVRPKTKELRKYVPELDSCQLETTENWIPAERYHRCKKCGAFFAVMDASRDIQPRFCPNCGAKVVDE